MDNKSWSVALKEWNSKTQRPFRYAIPLKGSPENLLIREMMKGKKFRLRTLEPNRSYEETNDQHIFNLIKGAEEYLRKEK